MIVPPVSVGCVMVQFGIGHHRKYADYARLGVGCEFTNRPFLDGSFGNQVTTGIRGSLESRNLVSRRQYQCGKRQVAGLIADLGEGNAVMSVSSGRGRIPVAESTG